MTQARSSRRRRPPARVGQSARRAATANETGQSARRAATANETGQSARRATASETGQSARRAATANQTGRRQAPSAPDPKVNGKRERNKAENRAAILAAARDVFTDLGYDGATVRDIIRRTNLASGTFYNYFPDKESVFRALLHEGERRRVEWLGRAPLRTSTYDEYLCDNFRAYFEFVAADRTMFDLLRRNAGTIRAFSEDPVLVGEVHRLRHALEQGMNRGVLPRLDAEYLASAMFGISFEIAVIMVDREPVDVEGATRFAADLFIGCMERARRPERTGRHRAVRAS